MTTNRPTFPTSPEPSPSPSQIGRRRLLGALATIPVVLTSLAPVASPAAPAAAPDPIFEMIEAHRRACAVHDEVVSVEFSFLDEEDPAFPAAKAATREACDVMLDLACEMIDAPATLAGAAALLAYVAEFSGETDNWRFPEIVGFDEGDEPFWVAVIKSVAGALGSSSIENGGGAHA